MPKKDIGLGIVSIGFGAWVYYIATTLKKKAAFWPKIVAVGIIALGVIILIQGIIALVKANKAAAAAGKTAEVKTAVKQETVKYLKVAAVVGLLVVFYFLFQYVSYILATVLLVTGTSVILGYRNWKVLIPTAIVVAVLLYVAFSQVFHVHFPGAFY